MKKIIEEKEKILPIEEEEKEISSEIVVKEKILIPELVVKKLLEEIPITIKRDIDREVEKLYELYSYNPDQESFYLKQRCCLWKNLTGKQKENALNNRAETYFKILRIQLPEPVTLGNGSSKIKKEIDLMKSLRISNYLSLSCSYFK